MRKRVLNRLTIIIMDLFCWIVIGGLFLFLDYFYDSVTITVGNVLPLGVLILLCMFLQTTFGLFTRIYLKRYRVGSFEDVFSTSVLATSSATIAFIIVKLCFKTLAIDTGDLLFLLFGALIEMLFIRALRRLQRYEKFNKSEKEPIFVIGAGEAGYWLVNQLRVDTASPYLPIGFIDDDPGKENLRMGGVSVVGNRQNMIEKARKYGVSTCLYAIHNATDQVMQDYFDICSDAQISMLIVPNIRALFRTKLSLDTIREINVEDLLGRKQVTTNLVQASEYITGRCVLVTGAGGSIGSEICRQVSKLSPSQLVMLDRDESSLHAIQLDIYGKGLLDTPDIVLCDIRDKEALRKIFEQHKPDVVFHTAALKHLPMLEQYPDEGWKTNVLGSLNLLELAKEFKVDRFVNISTDKAADPTSVLGYTKRLAERLTAYHALNYNLNFASVRFGNVLGSRGSVLWTFRHQIENGQPITITHPDVERYFMTIPEACQLVIQAGAIGNQGEVMVLDMGKPVKIIDVAKRMIALSRKNIEIVITGLRPGEKMSEVLVAEGETDYRPHHPLISHVKVEPITTDRLEEHHQKILTLNKKEK